MLFWPMKCSFDVFNGCSRNALALKNKKVQSIFGEVYFGIITLAVFHLQNHVSDFF